MKHLLSLTDLNKKQITEILDVANQMKRIVQANYKKGPQLTGAVVGGIWDKPCKSSTAFSLGATYLSGAISAVFGADDLLRQCQMFDSMGVNMLVVACDNDNLCKSFANTSRSSVINGGSSQYDPIAVLAYLMALSSKCDGLQNLSVLTVGNKQTNVVNELIHCLQLFNSSVVWYLPNDDYVTQRKGIVMDKAEAAFSGADAVIDLGLSNFSDPKKYYGTAGGISEKLMDKARIDCPLLGTRYVVDNVGVKEYPHSLEKVSDCCYVSVVMAILYLLNRK